MQNYLGCRYKILCNIIQLAGKDCSKSQNHLLGEVNFPQIDPNNLKQHSALDCQDSIMVTIYPKELHHICTNKRVELTLILTPK